MTTGQQIPKTKKREVRLSHPKVFAVPVSQISFVHAYARTLELILLTYIFKSANF